MIDHFLINFKTSEKRVVFPLVIRTQFWSLEILKILTRFFKVKSEFTQSEKYKSLERVLSNVNHSE